VNDLLSQAKAALKDGRKAEARRLLVRLIQQDPRDEVAWLWLSGAVDRTEDRRRCLEQILVINPGNELARRGLARLGFAPEAKVPESIVDAGREGLDSEAQALRAKWPAKRVVGLSAMVLGGVALVIAIAFTPLPSYLSRLVGGGAEGVAPSPRQNTPQPDDAIAVPTAIPTWTPTPLPAVSTATPTPLPPATSTAIPRPTDAGFTPGDPTATPLGEEIVDAYYLQGKEAYEAGDYDRVLVLMNLVLEANPNLAPPHLYRGMAYFHLGDYESGLFEMDQALAIDPEYALAYADRGSIYAALGDWDKAVVDWERALEIDPSLAKVHHNLGVMYFDQGNYLRALYEYNMALAIDPTRASSFYNRGEVLIQLGRYQECIDVANEAIERDPEFWVAYFTRGSCNLLLGNNQVALEDFLIYVEAVPDDYMGWFNLGVLYYRLGDTELALESYDRAIALDPDDPAPRYNRALIYMDLEEYSLAIADLDVVLAQGEFMDARDARGVAHYYLGNYNQAIADLRRSSELNPSRVATHAFLARAYFARERYVEAIEAASKGLAIDPPTVSTPICFLVRGRAYYELGDYGRAIEDLSAALEFAVSVEAYYYRGLAYQANGQIEEAIADFERCIVVHVPGDGMDAEVEDARVRLDRLRD
jgi:tetratricopeptide (TPR) repeat protein